MTPRLPPAAILIGVTATAPVAMHLIVPSMPGLVESFGTSPAAVQLTLTLYMLALAVATLGCGPLSDRFGRRPVVLGALALFVLASAVCASAPSIEILIAARIVQAIGGAAGLTLGRAMVRDCLDANRAASMIATLSMIMSVIPALSPALGGYLDVWLGWRAGFVALAAFGLLVLVAAVPRLNETNPHAGPHHGRVAQLAVFKDLIADRVFLGYALHCVCTLSAWYGIVASAPHVMLVVMGYAPSDYGAWFVLVAAGWITGNLLTSRIAPLVGIERLVPAGALVAIGGSASLLAFVTADALSPLRLFLPLAIIGVGHGLSQPSSMSAAIGVRPDAAGRASGLLGFMQMTCGALVAQSLGFFQDSSAWPLAVSVLSISVVSLLAFLLAAHRR